MLKKRMLTVVILMVAIFGFVLPAFATPISTIFHDYGTGTGKVDPGGNDPLYADYVKISDNSSERFWDVFDFSTLNFDTITSFDLTLDFSDAGATGIFWGIQFPTEDWRVRPATSTSSATNTLFDLTNSQARMTQTLSFDTGNLDIFDEIVNNKKFYLWFAEETNNWWTGDDDFNLYSATLDIYGTQTDPVPEPTTLLLLGFGLLGIAGVSRRNN